MMMGVVSASYCRLSSGFREMRLLDLLNMSSSAYSERETQASEWNGSRKRQRNARCVKKEGEERRERRERESESEREGE